MSVPPEDTSRRPTYGRQARIGVLWSAFRESGRSILAIPTAVVMARLLSPEDFGVAAIAGLFITLATRLMQFGLNAALIRVKELRREHESSVLAVTIITGVASFVVLLLIAPFAGRFFSSDAAAAAIPVAAFVFLITPWGTVPHALLSRRLEFRQLALADFVSALVESVAAIVLGMRGFGYWAIIYARLLGAAVSTVALVLVARWTPSIRFARQAFQELFSFGAGVQVKRLLDYAGQNIDTLLVGRILGLNALGYYDKAFSTMNRFHERLLVAWPVTFRVFAMIHEEPERFRRALRTVLLTGSLSIVPTFVFLATVAPELFVVAFGERWRAAADPFRVLSMAAICRALASYVGSAIEAMGLVWSQSLRQLITTVIIGVGVAIGASQGILGASIGVLAGSAFLAVSLMMLLKREARLRWSDLLAPQIPALLASLGLLLILVMTERLLASLTLAPWELLLVQLVVFGIWMTAFLLFAPLADMRSVLNETLEQFAPDWIKRLGVRRPRLAANGGSAGPASRV